MTYVAAGVLRRTRSRVNHPPRERKVRRPPEYFLSDTVEDAFREAEDRKHLANRLKG